MTDTTTRLLVDPGSNRPLEAWSAADVGSSILAQATVTPRGGAPALLPDILGDTATALTQRVRVDVAQSLSPTQQARGRGNLGAAASGANADITDLLGVGGAGVRFRAASTQIPSAATVDLGAAPTRKVAISGTTTITSFGSVPHAEVLVHFLGALTLTHDATALVLPGGASIVTAAGDAAIVTSDAAGNWRVREYTRADGTPLVLPSMARQPSFRNRIRNGAFTINQRGVSGTVTLAAGQYGHDGFKAGANGCTYTFVRAGGITAFNVSAGNLQQPIEGALYLTEGGTYTLSWGGTAQARINSTTNPFSASPIVANNLTPDFNAVVEWGTGTLWLPQFEPGAVATPFERRDDELRRCLRYFERIGGDASRVSIMLMGFFSSTQLNGTLSFAPKRVAPTLLFSAANQWRLLGNGGAPIPATLTAVTIGLTRADIYATGSGFSANAYLLQSIDNPTDGQQPYVDIRAEL